MTSTVREKSSAKRKTPLGESVHYCARSGEGATKPSANPLAQINKYTRKRIQEIQSLAIMDNNDNEEDEELFLLKVLAARLAQHELTDAVAAVPPPTGSSKPAAAAAADRSVKAGRTSRPTIPANNKSENQSGLTLDTEENSFVVDSAGESSTSTTENAQYASRRHRETFLVSTCGATGTAAATTTVPGAYDVAGPDRTMPGVQTPRRPSFLTANPHVASSDSMSSFSGSDSDCSRENGEMPPIDTETAEEEAAPEDSIQREKKMFRDFSKRQRILIACAVCAILAIATGLLVSFLPRDKGSNTPLRNSYDLDQPSRPSQVSEDYPQPGGPPVHDWKPTLRPSATSKTTMAPSTTPTATPLPECALNLDQNETGYVELRLQGMPTEEDGTLPDNVKEELEELFREVYRNVSGLCLDPYNRVLEQATLTESTTAARENDDQVASILTTYWDARVTCNGCPSEEPLFSTGSSETIRRRLQEDLRLFDQSTDFLPLFASTLGYHLNELLKKQQPQQTINSTVAGVNVFLATTKRPAISDTSTISSENEFISVISVDKDTIESFDEYVTSINGQVLAPFATDELRVLEACYAVGKNREDATQVTGVCQYYLQDESLGLEVAGANNCFQSVLAMERYCQDALGPLFDALVSGTKEGLDFNAIPTGGSLSLDAIWELASDRTIAPTKTLLSYQGVPTALTGTGSSSPTTKAGAATFNPSPSPSQSVALDTKEEERDTPENAPSVIAEPTVSTSSPTVSKATILPGSTLQPIVEPAPSPAPFLTPLPTLDPTLLPTAMSVSGISVEIPTVRPTKEPTPQPTRLPSTPLPTRCPTPNPTVPPTRSTPEATPAPTPSPTPDPTLQPAPLPTRLPSTAAPSLSLHPSLHPSPAPSYKPSTSNLPSAMPSSSPSLRPSGKPSIQPSSAPSGSPSLSILPTAKPSLLPSWAPSLQPSLMPSGSPSLSPVPSSMPSAQPSLRTSDTPSSKPTEGPSSTPSKSISPSGGPSSLPSVQPSRSPSLMPSRTPSNKPSVEPSGEPSQAPSLTPSQAPTAQTCFADNWALWDAVRDDYTDPNGSIYLTYGPVENWCFEASVNNFGGLFGSITFNEDISGWDVAGVTNFGGAFEWNSNFNQDISGWDVSRSIDFGVSQESKSAIEKSCSLRLTQLSDHILLSTCLIMLLASTNQLDRGT